MRLSAWSGGELSFWKWPNCSLTSHISIFSYILLIHNFNHLFQIISWRSFSIRLRIVFRCPSLSTPRSIRSSLIRSFRCFPSISFFLWNFQNIARSLFQRATRIRQPPTSSKLNFALLDVFSRSQIAKKYFKIMANINYISIQKRFHIFANIQVKAG